MHVHDRCKKLSVQTKKPICLHLSIKLVSATPKIESQTVCQKKKEGSGRLSIGSKSTNYSRSDESNKKMFDENNFSGSLANYIKGKIYQINEKDKKTKLRIIEEILKNPNMKTTIADKIYHSTTPFESFKNSFTFGAQSYVNLTNNFENPSQQSSWH